MRSIATLAKAFPDALVGAGTVLQPEQVREVHAAGGQLVVAPNFNAEVVREAVRLGMVCLPGVLTPTEAFAALAAGASGLKLFPAEMIAPAGVKALRAVLPAEALRAACRRHSHRQHGGLSRGGRRWLRHRLRALQAGHDAGRGEAQRARLHGCMRGYHSGMNSSTTVSFGLAGRVCIVTGGAQGIGEACARRFAREGAKVVIVDVDDARGQALATDLGGLYVHCDVGDKAQVDAARGADHRRLMAASTCWSTTPASSRPPISWTSPKPISTPCCASTSRVRS